MLDITSFGRWLKLRRIALELTQAELACLTGCTEVTIRKIEADERRPSRELAQRLAASLELPHDDRASFLKAARAELGAFRLSSPMHAAAAATPRGSVSLPRTPLIGREPELATVRVLLQDAGVGLVTLTGPGGIGKTRLALEIAAGLQGEFRDGAWFVDLAPLRDHALVASSIAAVLGLQEQRGQPVAGLLRAYLCDKQILLVLDNFEHLLPAAPLVADLLASAPGLTVLVTSRAALHLRGEREVAVPPLALPDPEPRPSPERLLRSEAVRLFVARAKDHTAGFQVTDASAPAVADICRRLDGLPLAIELAAARISVLTPQGLLARLERRLTLLTGGPRDLPARQQTIRATIAWSYDLLEPTEQGLLTRLGVFAGGCTLEAIEVVCSARDGLPSDMLDSVQALVNTSLLRQEPGPGDEPRFVMLETVREFALEQLAARGEVDALHGRHAAYYLGLAEAGEVELHGPRQLIWLDRLECEHDNVRVALAWALDAGEAELGLRLAGALFPFWELHWHDQEGVRWLNAALAAGSHLPAALRAKAQIAAGRLVYRQGDPARARELLEQGQARNTADRALEGQALLWLGIGAWDRRDIARASAHLQASLACARAAKDQVTLAWALHFLGLTAKFRCDWDQEAALYAESLALFRAVGDRSGISLGFYRLGQLAWEGGNIEQATRLLEESLALWRELGSKGWIADCLRQLAQVAISAGDYGRAVALAEENFRREHAAGTGGGGLLIAYNLLGNNVRDQGDYDRATALLEECLALARALDDRAFCVWPLHDLGETALLRGDDACAQRWEEQALALAREIGHTYAVGVALLNPGYLAGHPGDHAGAAGRKPGLCAGGRRNVYHPPLSGRPGGFGGGGGPGSTGGAAVRRGGGGVCAARSRAAARAPDRGRAQFGRGTRAVGRGGMGRRMGRGPGDDPGAGDLLCA